MMGLEGDSDMRRWVIKKRKSWRIVDGGVLRLGESDKGVRERRVRSSITL